MRVLARIAVVFLFLLTVSTTVFGQEFHILNLTQSLGLPFGSGVSLNDQDVIATLVVVESIQEIVTVNINGDFTNLTQGQFDFLGQPSINNLGQIVFPVYVEPPTAVNGDAIFWNGSIFQNITNSTIHVYPAGVLGRALNDSGLVAIGSSQGLALYDGVHLTLLTSGTSITDTGNPPPSINAGGQIAFLGRSYWIPGSYAPLVSEKRHSCLRLLKNKAFKEERRTKNAVYAIGECTTLESNKSLKVMQDGPHFVAPLGQPPMIVMHL